MLYATMFGLQIMRISLIQCLIKVAIEDRDIIDIALIAG